MAKVKIVGYAKKEVFGNGVEYRNFSPDLVGNQFASNEGTPIFTSGNFNITTNLDSKVDKEFVTNKFTDFISLDSLNLDETLESVLTKYSKNAKLNLDYTDALTYAFFGSFREYIRVSLENIIIKWPASLYVREINVNDPALTGKTVDNYVYSSLNDTSTFEISTDRIENNFDINFLSGGTIENTFNESNVLRNLTLNYASFVISNINGDFQVTNLIGAASLTNSTLYLTVKGNPFPDYSSDIIDYHIKPNKTKIESFFFNLNEFENNLLNRLTIPEYTSTFTVYNESETGSILETQKKLIWPVSDGYNIDFNSLTYINFVSKLLEIADVNDDSKSNLMVRFLVSKSISEFDSIPDINGTYVDGNGQKMTSTLKIYGREFDEIKKYSDGISFANTVTYDKKNNTPDIVLKNLARVLGWELTTSISQIDVLGNFLSLNSNYYDGHSRGLTDAEAEIELWRRIVLNTPWIWKSKGTRKAIEFLFKFIGAPSGLVSFNEYLYVAKTPVDVELTTQMMEYFNDTTDLSSLNLDTNGFPKVLPNTPEMYFQKAGLWYRQTGGDNPDIDLLEGNNPHIGPYDGGQAYMEQFTNCLIPNYSGSTGEVSDLEENVNLFTNYGNGTFDECCDSSVLVVLNTNYDFQSIATTNVNKIYDNYSVTETGCTINNSWSIVAALTGETFYNEVFFNSTGDVPPSESDYVNALNQLSGTTNLTGSTFNYSSVDKTFTIISDNDNCDSELLDTYIKVEICVDSTYNCIDECISGLTSFMVSTLTDDACSPTNALPLNVTYYHNGAGTHPTVGDTVYSNICGLNTVYHPSGDTVFTDNGIDFAMPEAWLQTDANGVMEEIICPVVACTVQLGRDSLNINGVSYDRFFLTGLNELNYVSMNYQITNMQLSPNSTANPFITDSLGQQIKPTNLSPLVNLVNIINDTTNVYDYTATINPRGSYDPLTEGYSVVISVVSMDKDCLINTNSITFHYGTNRLIV